MTHLADSVRGAGRLFPILVLVLALSASVTVVLAEGGDKGSWELGGYVGYGFLDDYDGGGAVLDPDNDLLFGLRAGYFMSPRLSLEGSIQTLMTETDLAVPPNADVDLLSYRLNLLHNFRPGQSVRPFLTAGVGREETDIQKGRDEADFGFNLGGGLRWYLTESIGLRGDLRWVSTDVNGPIRRQENWETSLGVLWAFGGKTPGDADGDGVLDRRDKCPDTPRGARVDEDGCPKDSDGDGVYDGIDKCPDTKPGVPVDASGCPRDSDRDGVHDGLDKCPDTPGGAEVDADGCPKDSDGDGVYDGLDKCPDTPRGAVVNAKGCPKDSDGDGVYDGLDKCPDTKRGVKVDETGCAILFEKDQANLVLEGVKFEFDSDQLTADSKTVLDGVAASLQDWKEIRIEVAGHTDSKGRDAYNLNLSQKRAESVRRYLIEQGVNGSRVVAKGYGETQPVADNATDRGRSENRRVELRKVD